MSNHSWSISKVQVFEDCALAYKKRYLEGNKPPPFRASERGSLIHEKAERYLNGKIRGLPPELEKLGSHYKNLKKIKPMTEVKLSVDESWNVNSWNDGWCRGVLDVLDRTDDEIIIIDHKTGKVYEKHVDQAEVYACLTHSTALDAKKIHVEFWYIDQGFVKNWDFSAGKVLKLKEYWTGRANRMLKAKRFPAQPSHKSCQYCHIRSDKGGSCHAWKKV